MLVILVQFVNALVFILVTALPIVQLDKRLQSLNKPSPKIVTQSPITTEVTALGVPSISISLLVSVDELLQSSTSSVEPNVIRTFSPTSGQSGIFCILSLYALQLYL